MTRQNSIRQYGTRIFSISSIFIFLFSIFACYSQKNSTAVLVPDASDREWILRYDRGPCFGQCPVYSFYVLSDSTGLLDVRGNFLPSGWYSGKIKAAALQKIFEQLTPASWWKEDLTDVPEIPDLPALRLTYHYRHETRSWHGQSRISHERSMVTRALSQLVEDVVWEETAWRPKPDETPHAEIIVHLREETDIQDWIKAHKNLDLILRKRLSPGLPYYLVAMGKDSPSPNDVIELIRADAAVVAAEWDKAIQNRKP